MALDFNQHLFSLPQTYSFGQNPHCYYREFCWLSEFPSNLIICVLIHLHTQSKLALFASQPEIACGRWFGDCEIVLKYQWGKRSSCICGPTPRRNFRFLSASLGRRKHRLGVALGKGSWEAGKTERRAFVRTCAPDIFSDVLCKHYLIVLGNCSILDSISGTPGHHQDPGWGGGEALAEHLARGCPRHPNRLWAGHLCTEIWIKRGAAPENLEIYTFLLNLPGTPCQTLGLSDPPLVTEGCLSWSLRDGPVPPFCDSLIHSFISCATVCSSEHRSRKGKFCSLRRTATDCRSYLFHLYSPRATVSENSREVSEHIGITNFQFVLFMQSVLIRAPSSA